MKKLEKKIRNNSIKGQLMIFIFCLVVVCSIAVAIISYVSFQSILLEEIGNNRVDVLKQTSRQSQQIKNTTATISNLYYYDETLNDFLDGKSDISDDFMDMHIESLTKKLENSFESIEINFEILLLGYNGYVYCSNSKESDLSYVNSKIWMKDVIIADGEINWVANYTYQNDPTNYISAARIMSSNKEINGVLLINVKEQYLRETYTNVLTDTNYVYIVDDGHIVSSNKEFLIGNNFFNMNKLKEIFEDSPYVVTEIAGREVLFTYLYDNKSQWYFLEEISKSQVMNPISAFRVPIALGTIAICIISIIISLIWVKRIINPIQKLCKIIQNIDDESLDENFNVGGYHEINVLSDGISAMLSRIRILIESIVQKETQKRKIELSLLQSQINPHFIYNTLFSVKCMIQMDKNKQASEMLSSFIAVLQNTLSSPDEFVKLKDEMDILEKYIMLQKLRYDEHFETKIFLEKNIEDYLLPKLLLQPLVENAIFHGIGNQVGGEIVISAYGEGEYVFVEILDNGVGIEEEQMQIIIKGEILGRNGGFGIRNIPERMKLFFGNDCSFDLSSEKNIGTCVQLKFPKIE